MIIDFPDYTHANPWQTKTLQTSAPMDVKVTNNLELTDCYALHISWEDILLRGFETPEKANELVDRFSEYLAKQSLRSKIIWTVHNLTSHSYPLKHQENALRDVIMEYASVINLMSMKHAFIIPEKYRSKIHIVPHYIDPPRFPEVIKNKDLTYFRYGADRGRKDNELYLSILNNNGIKKFVSDARLDIEIDNISTVITRRRFTFLEAEMYARLSSFSTYYQEPQFNSGVLNEGPPIFNHSH